jgi:hypothetical protein
LFCAKAVTFLKKSNQKTFAPAGFGPGVAPARRTKSFLLLFFKKEAFPFLVAFISFNG